VNSDGPGASAEEVAAEATRRLWIRRAAIVVVLSLGVALTIGAVLPTTAPADRAGLLLGSGMVAVAGVLWFVFVRPGRFGDRQIFIACAIAQLIMLVTLEATGGLGSMYFPYYLLPLLVMVMAASREQTLVLGVLAGAGLLGIAVVGSDADQQAITRDAFAVRFLELLTFTIAATAASQAMGAIRSSLAAQTRALAQQARSDPLTGLGNRKALLDDLPRLLSAAERRGAALTVVALDLDGLKSVNDRHGHAAGDRLLCAFSDLLRACVRAQDLAVRAGGDEFILVLPDTDAAGARHLLERVEGAASLASTGVRFSAGTATSTAGMTADWLLALADDALYAQKAVRPNTG
jgi:diguanylate cyclase (GGDEF)-like protein